MDQDNTVNSILANNQFNKADHATFTSTLCPLRKTILGRKDMLHLRSNKISIELIVNVSMY